MRTSESTAITVRGDLTATLPFGACPTVGLRSRFAGARSRLRLDPELEFAQAPRAGTRLRSEQHALDRFVARP